MFAPITIPFGVVMLFNVVKLKDGVTTEDVELALGEMCNVVKNTYGDEAGGFIGLVYATHFGNIGDMFLPDRYKTGFGYAIRGEVIKEIIKKEGLY